MDELVKCNRLIFNRNRLSPYSLLSLNVRPRIHTVSEMSYGSSEQQQTVAMMCRCQTKIHQINMLKEASHTTSFLVLSHAMPLSLKLFSHVTLVPSLHLNHLICIPHDQWMDVSFAFVLSLVLFFFSFIVLIISFKAFMTISMDASSIASRSLNTSAFFDVPLPMWKGMVLGVRAPSTSPLVADKVGTNGSCSVGLHTSRGMMVPELLAILQHGRKGLVMIHHSDGGLPHMVEAELGK